MKLMVFDAMDPPLRGLPYKQRFQFLAGNLSESHPFAVLAVYSVCVDRDYVETVSLVRSYRGEGIILRDPDAHYANGYSRSFYKHKGFNDAEAQVLQKLNPSRYLCAVNKQQLRHTAQNQESSYNGTLDAGDFINVEMIVDPLVGLQDIPVGRFVSFKYLVDPKATASIYVIRDDLNSWDQLLHKKNTISEHNTIWKPKRFNDWNEVSNHRKFFDQFAAENNFDPLLASNWYKQNRKAVIKQAPGLLLKYGNSLVTALVNNYPEIDLQPELFAIKQHKYWTSKENRRKFFDSYATKRSFSPLVPNNWYSIDTTVIKQEKGGDVVLGYYKGSVINALLDLYPNIGLDKYKFKSVTANHWVSTENRKSFFDRLATSLNLDPSDPTTWYSITREQVLRTKAGRGVMWYYNYSYVKAITSIYPNIGLDSYKFSTPPRKYWDEPSNRKKFFESFAEAHNFSPLNAASWYTVDRDDILKTKSGKLVLSYYCGSFAIALVSIYPSINLDISQMRTIPRNYWTVKENRKMFFDSFARGRALDPLIANTWYTTTRGEFKATKGGIGVLNHYKGSHTRALLDIYPSIGLQPHLLH